MGRGGGREEGGGGQKVERLPLQLNIVNLRYLAVVVLLHIWRFYPPPPSPSPPFVKYKPPWRVLKGLMRYILLISLGYSLISVKYSVSKRTEVLTQTALT